MSNPSVIHLDAARNKKAADLKQAKAACDLVYEYLTAVADSQARLAFSVSGSIWHHHQQFAIDINRSQWRRMRSIIRKTLKKAFAVGDTKATALDYADAVFVNRLAILGDERGGLRRAQR